MIFITKYGIGSKVWIPVDNRPFQATVGKVLVEHTDSQGIDGEELFDNYKPQKSHHEKYMCDETGVGTGSVWEEGKNIFPTERDCAEYIQTRD